MAKSFRPHKVSDATEPSEKADYVIGHGRAPAHSRVKLKEIRNPGGRPKGQRNARTVLRETLNERVKIREGNRTRSVTKLDAIILTMVNSAVSGNEKAQPDF